MYESITYAELKSLPREQKVEALKGTDGDPFVPEEDR